MIIKFNIFSLTSTYLEVTEKLIISPFICATISRNILNGDKFPITCSAKISFFKYVWIKLSKKSFRYSSFFNADGRERVLQFRVVCIKKSVPNSRCVSRGRLYTQALPASKFAPLRFIFFALEPANPNLIPFF